MNIGIRKWVAFILCTLLLLCVYVICVFGVDGTVLRLKLIVNRIFPHYVIIRSEMLDLYLADGGGKSAKLRGVTFLKGAPLSLLSVVGTEVSDLSPLSGMTLRFLDLSSSGVVDLSPLTNVSVRTLVLAHTGVSELSPIGYSHVEDLDISHTKVRDLRPLRTLTSLRRLNLVGGEIADLSGLDGLMLEELRFTDKNITNGINVVRTMSSLLRIGWGPGKGEVCDAATFWSTRDAPNRLTAPPAQQGHP